MITWPDEIIDDIARRRCVIFIGAGISHNSANQQGRRPATWEMFLKSSANGINSKTYVLQLIKQKDYLTACEIIKKERGEAAFTQLLRTEYLTPAYKPAAIHENIFKLDSRIVATPNIDKIYETYANAKANGSIIVKHQYDSDVADVIRNNNSMILKIHGTIDSARQVIFTRKEYAEARSKYQSFYKMLEALILTNTFVFLGCGINDPDIKLLLEDTFFKHSGQREHYIVLPSGEVHDKVKEIIKETMNLSIIEYNSRNNHRELNESVRQLSQSVDYKRQELARSFNW